MEASLRRIALPLVLVLAVPLTGCPDRLPRDDAGVPVDASEPDAQVPIDAGTPDDAQVDASIPPDAFVPDGGMPPTGTSEPAPAAEIVRAGTGGFLLRGTVLAPDGPITPGEVLIVGDTITCVAADCSAEPMADTVTIIDTHATISPGLIDAHNHLGYNFLPEWVPDPLMLWMNRYEWANDPGYEAHVEPYAAHRATGTHYCPAAKWGELRSIVHGTTTIQGQSFPQSCVNRLARNADHFHGLGDDELGESIPDLMQTNIGSVRDVTDAARATLVNSFRDGSTTRYAVHMAEGYAGSMVDREFASYAGRDTRTVDLFRDTDGTPFRTAMLIHSLGLTEDELEEAAMVGAYTVWSPSSNMVLYGRTVDIARLLELGVEVALGPDWTPSGADEMLSEMRFGFDFATAEAIPAVTTERLWDMATRGGAVVVGLDAHIGSLVVGRRADITVFGRTSGDPYRAVLDSRAQDVRLVMIDGAAYYGDLALESATAVNGDCEMLDACGTAKFLCAANTPGAMTATARATETVEEIRTQLYNILEGIGYPPDEQYGRGDELLPLVDCSL